MELEWTPISFIIIFVGKINAMNHNDIHMCIQKKEKKCSPNYSAVMKKKKIELAIIICHTFLLRDAITEYIRALQNEWKKKIKKIIPFGIVVYNMPKPIPKWRTRRTYHIYYSNSFLHIIITLFVLLCGFFFATVVVQWKLPDFIKAINERKIVSFFSNCEIVHEITSNESI